MQTHLLFLKQKNSAPELQPSVPPDEVFDWQDPRLSESNVGTEQQQATGHARGKIFVIPTFEEQRIAGRKYMNVGWRANLSANLSQSRWADGQMETT
jgi:hypothetical protein